MRFSNLERRGGAHLHRAFVSLDLDKALRSVETPILKNVLSDFSKAIIYQHFLKKSKQKKPSVYNQILGIFDFPCGFAEQESKEDSSSEDFDDIFSEPDSSNNSFDFGDSVSDDFLTVNINMSTKALSITVCPISIDANGVMQIDAANVRRHDLPLVSSCGSAPKFSAELQKNMKADLKNIISVWQDLCQKNANVKAAFRDLEQEVKNEFVDMGNRTSPKFAMLFNVWKRNLGLNNDYLQGIQNLVKNPIN